MIQMIHLRDTYEVHREVSQREDDEGRIRNGNECRPKNKRFPVLGLQGSI